MYRFAAEVFQPFAFLILFTSFALVYVWVTQRLALRRALPIAIGLTGLWTMSTPGVASIAVRSLESQYPVDTPMADAVDAFVVLGGGVRVPRDHRPELAENSVVRVVCAAKLYHDEGARRPVVVSGGSPSGPGGVAVAPLMGDLLQLLDVDPSDIIIESDSTNTFENARETARILNERGLRHVTLVTEATHMPRSVMSFRGQGVEVTPSGCNYRVSATTGEGMYRLLPSAGAASLVRLVAHEWIGIVWYWLNGRLTAA